MSTEARADMHDAKRAEVTALLLRMDEVAVVLSVSVRTVWTLIQTGELRAVRPPGLRAIRVAREDVDALVARWREHIRST